MFHQATSLRKIRCTSPVLAVLLLLLILLLLLLLLAACSMCTHLLDLPNELFFRAIRGRGWTLPTVWHRGRWTLPTVWRRGRWTLSTVWRCWSGPCRSFGTVGGGSSRPFGTVGGGPYRPFDTVGGGPYRPFDTVGGSEPYRPLLTCLTFFSLNWIIRSNQLTGVEHVSSHISSACAVTWDCRGRNMVRHGH